MKTQNTSWMVMIVGLTVIVLLLWSIMGNRAFAQKIAGGYSYSLAVKSDGMVGLVKVSLVTILPLPS